MRTALLASVIALSVTSAGSAQRSFAERINNRAVLTQIADNIVEHIEAVPHRINKGHAERLLLVEMVEDILIQSLHHQGYVRLEPIVSPK